jgi:hypothetical protein
MGSSVIVDHAGDLGSAILKGKLVYGAGMAAWIGSLGFFGKAGFLVGLVNPPAGILVGAIGAGAASYAAARLRKGRS